MRRLLRLGPYAPSGARGWYRGGAFGSLYIVIPVWAVWTSELAVGLALLATILLLIVGGAFVVMPPALWGRPRAAIYLALLAYAALICAFFPLIGASTAWLFIYPACAAASIMRSVLEAGASILVVGTVQLVILLVGNDLAGDGFAVLLTVSTASMVLGVASTSRAYAQLREAQGEVARLAVAEERARFSRDLHDVLGHSLTVVTVKSELAARLVDRDQPRAKSEIADIERLARSALADLRASIAGYRVVNLETELAAARAALAAAEVSATVPVSGDGVEQPLRELFAWAVRESVTNVIRHARAANCVIELSADAVTIADDGVGMAGLGEVGGLGGLGGVGGLDATDCDGPTRAVHAAHAVHTVSGMGRGHGLAGLAERAAAADAVLTVARRDPRGTVVTVRAGIR